jgi:hypothetical protein
MKRLLAALFGFAVLGLIGCSGSSGVSAQCKQAVTRYDYAVKLANQRISAYNQDQGLNAAAAAYGAGDGAYIAAKLVTRYCPSTTKVPALDRMNPPNPGVTP